MQLHQSTELRQGQQLRLTPQLRQAIRILQSSAEDLEQEISQALLDNPLLELDEEVLGDESEIDVAEMEQNAAHGKQDGAFEVEEWRFSRANDRDDEYWDLQGLPDPTLQQHLLEQLRLTHATIRDRGLVELLIGELDDNGYLTISFDELTSFLPQELDVERNEWQTAISLLQSFDPAGIGARSVSECLLIQIKRRENAVSSEVLSCAQKLADEYLGLLASGNLARLCELLGCNLNTLGAARQLLLQLDPKPGRGWAQSTASYIKPDIIVRKISGHWTAFINQAVVPPLRVNTDYERIIKQEKRTGEADSLQQQLQQAYGLIKSVHQRFETVLRVASAVIKHQQAFFDQGEQALRPLVLREIAQELQMHESTVSRATRQKYIQTLRGVFELKYFFTISINRDNGGDTSSARARALIQDLIDQEPSTSPFSDNHLVSKLSERGVVIARRTVAKYRETTGIPVASLRRARARLDDRG